MAARTRSRVLSSAQLHTRRGSQFGGAAEELGAWAFPLDLRLGASEADLYVRLVAGGALTEAGIALERNGEAAEAERGENREGSVGLDDLLGVELVGRSEFLG